MKVTERQYHTERDILIGMLVSRIVVAHISAVWEPPMFESPWSNQVAKWCVEYFRRYDKPPGRHIQRVFNRWAESAKNKDVRDVIAAFLSSLSDQYAQLRRECNAQLIIDDAGMYFNRVRLERLALDIQGHNDDGNTSQALEMVTGFRSVNMGAGSYIKPMEDTEAIREAFEHQQERLIEYRDGLGEFFGNELCRDAFIAFVAPDKRGKSYWLLDMAFRAMIQNRRVAFFECGDLSEHQIMRRFMCRVARRPLSISKPVEYPTRLVLRDKKPPLVDTQIRRYKKPLHWRWAYKAASKLLQGKRLDDALRLSIHSNSSLKVSGIESTLDEWRQTDEWVPDVIIIDYADILDMTYPGLEGRDCIDMTWKHLRRMSQERHCLVLTATQSDAAAYDAHIILKKHFSGDKRKNAHVTGMIGLNQSTREKERGLMRLNWVVLREGWYSETKCCHVATCFPLANMAVKSVF